MDPLALIRRLSPEGSRAAEILITHGGMVAARAAAVAMRFPAVDTDFDFLYEAAILHDIGMLRTDAPSLGCYGTAPYIRHGVLGRGMLEEEGLPRHALVCERHFLAGVSAGDIVAQGLDLPVRDMFPVSREEKLICYADCFYSKKPGNLTRERTPAKALASLPGFCRPVFSRWLEEFLEIQRPVESSRL
jgi:uncharacterized protein